MSRALKQDDLLKLSKLYKAEFNQPDLHDRVLVFDVVASQVEGVCDADVDETSEAGSWSEDGDDAETTKISNKEKGKNAGNEHEARSRSDTKNANGDQQNQNTLSNEPQNDDFRTATKENETTLHHTRKSTEIQETEDAPVTDRQETVQNDLETRPTPGSENEMEVQTQLEIPNDDNDAYLSLNDKERIEDGREIFSDGNKVTRNESNEATSFPTGEEQVIGQNKFYIHSSVLAAQSSYFHSLFFSGMKESNATEVHLQILASEKKAHLMLLEAMYKIDVLDKANVDELLEVLKLADKYDVQVVFKKCKYCLQTMANSLDVYKKIMRFIKVENTITDVEDLASTLQSLLAQEFSPLDETWQTRSFKELCEPSVRYLLSSDELVAESENTIFHALMYWAEQQGIEKVLENGGTPSILSVVRFELIPIDYLYNIVQRHSVAEKFPDFIHHYLRGISYHALSDSMKERVPCQTGRRKPSTELFFAYTWVIPVDELDDLVGTEKQLTSDPFWYCGYKMDLTISDVVNLDKKEIFTATLSLDINNVTKQSDVKIQWQAASQSFKLNPVKRTHTFDGNPYMSSAKIKYKMEAKITPKLFGNIPDTRLLTELESIRGHSSRTNAKAVGPASISKQECTKSCLSIDVKVKLI